MLANISQCGSSQKSVHDCMNQHIRVGMSEKTFFIRNRNASQDQIPTLYQLVDVVSLSNSHCCLSFISISFLFW